MGIFDGSDKKKAVKDEVVQKLSEADILDDIIYTIMNSEHDWITTCQSYYDNLRRTVVVGPDLLRIKWHGYKFETKR